MQRTGTSLSRCTAALLAALVALLVVGTPAATAVADPHGGGHASAAKHADATKAPSARSAQRSAHHETAATAPQTTTAPQAAASSRVDTQADHLTATRSTRPLGRAPPTGR